MEKVSLSALSIALLLHTVMGVSYYFLLGRCSPGPLLGSWLFIASIGTAMATVHIFPRWWYTSSILCRLAVETVLCCVTLDVMLTNLWCRIEGLCHSAIVGVLQHLVTEDRTFANCEYWMLGITTAIIGSCVLWLTLWATALPQKLRTGYDTWQAKTSRSLTNNMYKMAIDENARKLH